MIPLIPLIVKVPWISNVVTLFTSKKRLLLEYFLIALVVMIAGFTFTMWLQKGRLALSLAETQTELVSVHDRLTVVETVNTQQEETIASLNELRVSDARALGSLITDYKFLAQNDLQARKRLDSLEQTNETVRTYLNQPVPLDLICLFDQTCPAGDKGSN